MSPYDNAAPAPFDREPPWPRFESLALGRADEDDDLDDEARVWFDSLPDDDEALEAPLAPDLAPQRPAVRPRLRLTPILGATAVGLGGLLALFLLIGGPDTSAAASAPAAASVATAQAGR